MLQPFWVIALLSNTRARVREIMGYTLAVMPLAFLPYLAVVAVA